MTAKLLLGLLLLATACGKSPEDRAKANALRMLAHERNPPVKPAPGSLKVFDLTRAQVSHYTSDVPTFGDGHLVTYAADAAPATRRAVFVADNDSAFFFLPSRNAAEFSRQFGVPVPAAPDSAASQRRLP